MDHSEIDDEDVRCSQSRRVDDPSTFGNPQGNLQEDIGEGSKLIVSGVQLESLKPIITLIVQSELEKTNSKLREARSELSEMKAGLSEVKAEVVRLRAIVVEKDSMMTATTNLAERQVDRRNVNLASPSQAGTFVSQRSQGGDSQADSTQRTPATHAGPSSGPQGSRETETPRGLDTHAAQIQGTPVNLGPREMSEDLSFMCEEDVHAPDILKKKMPKRKRYHDDANNNHVKASKDVPQPKKLQKKPAEKSSDHQQKEKKEDPLDDPIAETLLCQQRFVSAKQTVNLSELTYDLLVEIAKRLKKLEDFTCFRSVSKSLHLCVKEEYFEGLRLRQGTPYLMLPVRDDGTNDDVRELYSLVEGESIVASLEVPKFKSSTMCFESLGWLLTVQADGSMGLLDPFSNTEIPVPHQNTFPEYELYATEEHMFIQKMVLSSRPNETSDFILMVICGDYSHLAFWRLGDEAWNRIEDRIGCFTDVVYDGGEQFYAISNPGIIWVINLAAGNDNRVECGIIDCHPVLHIMGGEGNQYILKTIDGSLLGITRTKELQYYLTSEFQVYEIDTETSTWKEIYSLGSMAVFLGRNSSIAVDASKFPTTGGGGVIKANHIYFTDDFGECQNIYFNGGDWRAFSNYSQEAKGGCVDSGVYNFGTGAIEPIYPVEPLLSNVCPAMWITPNLYVSNNANEFENRN